MKTITKTKVHTVYKDADGNTVPGVTTVLGILAKPALIHWAWDLGTKQIDYKKYRDKMADIGTLAHLMILEYLKKEEFDYREFSQEEIDKAENCLISFYSWIKENNVVPIEVETPLVSSLYGYGGTIDLYCWLNDVPTLVDFKTGKAIYSEYFMQVSAYKQLLHEAHKPVSQVRILRIGRDETEGFEDHRVTNIDDYWNIFFYALNIYKTQSKLKREVA